MPSKITVHPILAKRIEHVKKLRAEMERTRQEYGEAVDRYVEAKARLEIAMEKRAAPGS